MKKLYQKWKKKSQNFEIIKCEKQKTIHSIIALSLSLSLIQNLLTLKKHKPLSLTIKISNIYDYCSNIAMLYPLSHALPTTTKSVSTHIPIACSIAQRLRFMILWMCTMPLGMFIIFMYFSSQWRFLGKKRVQSNHIENKP